MKAFLTPFSVGLVVIGGFAAFAWMMGQVKEGIDDDASSYRVYAIFKDASGLADKSKVTVAGINVGQIDKVELIGDEAKVWIRVNTPLRSDAQVAKKQASLLGEYYLRLTPGYQGEPLKDGDQIKNIIYDVPTSDLINELKGITSNVNDITISLKKVLAGRDGEERLVQIVENVNKTVEEVRRAVVDNGPKVDRVVDNVVAVSREARGFVKEFRSDARVIMRDAKTVVRDAKTVARDAKVVTADARAISGGVRALVAPATLSGQPGPPVIGPDGKVVDAVAAGTGKPRATVSTAVEKLESALANLDGTLAKTRSIAEKIDSGEGTIGKLVNDGRLIDGVSDLVDESSRFLRRLTRLQVLVSMRGEYYVSQGAVKNYLELRLQPRPDKYYSIQIVDDPRGSSRFSETVTTTSDSMSDPVVRTQESVTENQFRLSVQFAKSYYFMTGRIGIIESTGGVGLDFNLFNSSLELSTDLFGFDANVSPRLRARATYRFFTHLYVAAGVDDVFNDELSDFFMGAGVQFTDEDLQAILTVAPTPAL